MRAVSILQEELGESLGFLHTKRGAALWRVVVGLLRGQELWLTELGRNLPGTALVKHRIKAADRFVGSAAMQSAVAKIHAALASVLLRSNPRPVLLVDWTGAESGFYVLSAKIAFAGRALSILSRSYPETKKSNPDVERAFLNELTTIIPPHCVPVLVTDAGFLFKWIDSVRALGWDYVGRVRLGTMMLSIGGKCMRLQEAYQLARRKPRDLGTVLVGKNNPRPHRMSLSARPINKGRHRLGRKGRPLASSTATKCQAAAREPLVLITSLPHAARVVVDIYRTRMQIEETFRDLKSHRYGWGMRHIRTTNPRRLDVLLLIGAVAAVAMHLLGLTIRAGTFARGLQANTERSRNVFSSFFLGRLAVRQKIERRLSTASLRAAFDRLIAQLPSIDRIATP